MKKTIKIAGILVVAILFLLFVFKVTYVGDGKIDEGTYLITDSEKYPDASVIVEGDTIQFQDIDLNEIYQEEQIEQYNSVKELGSGISYSDAEIKEYSDLNKLMVDNAFDVQYDRQSDAKSGTFQYTYFLYAKDSMFGLVIAYDSFHKTLHINNEIQEITFAK